MPSTVLERIAAGDATAVRDCMEHYGGLVGSLARRMTGNFADAEDAAQEIFIEIWRTAARFDAQRASESTFITMIAKRRLIDRQRRRSRRPDLAPIEEEPVDPVVSDLDRLQSSDEAEQARRMMERLRPEEKDVLELSIDHGKSQSEIAEMTRLPLGTVKTHARRGLMRLRELLAADPPPPRSGESS